MSVRRVSITTLVAAPLLLTGCITNDSFGRGPVKLDRNATVNFETYKKLNRPLYFAVSGDGKASFGLYCSDYRCGDESIARVLSECESRSGGVPCKIFANGRTIVWDGQISFSAGGSATPPAQLQSTTIITRTIAYEWEDYQSLGSGIAVIDQNGKSGTIRFELPDKIGHCDGKFTFKTSSEGVWAVQCPDGKDATGFFTTRGVSKGSSGTGADRNGKKIRWTLSGEDPALPKF